MTCLKSFVPVSENLKPGLDVDDSALLQLRKSCRILSAVKHLKQQNGYYTVVIEASFASIERTIQFYLQEKGYIHEDEFIDHEKVYKMGDNAGLYGPNFRDKLIQLWKNNRSRTYYREGVGTKQTAGLMIELAE